jgi:hypothetical protein
VSETTGHTSTDQAGPTPRPDPPDGAVLADWFAADVGHSTYGWDKRRTYQLVNGRWVMMHDGAVIHGADRTAAADPDFPDRADEDDPDGHGPEAMTEFTIRMLRGHGELREKQVRMSTSRARDMLMLDKAGTGAWLGASTTRNGRAALFQASLALSEASGRTSDVFYSITGHHVLSGGERVFIGGTRAISAAGARPDLVVATDSRLAAWTFPDPLAAAEMDDGLAEVLCLTSGIDGRIIVPQLATVWRAMLGVYRDPADPGAGDEVSPTTWCTGPTGQGKSGTTAAAVNCGGAPGVRYNTLPFKAGPSNKGGGISGPALERVLFRARDLCIPFDDLDPSVTVADARTWQSNFLRSLADQKSRAVAAGAEGLREARPARCLAIASGEPMDGEDSAVNRALNLPFERGTVRIGELRKLTGPDERMIRARFGTAALCEILADYDGARAMLASQREARRPMFLAGRGESGPVLRGAGVAAELMATLDVILALAVRRGASQWLADRAREDFELAMLDAWARHLEIIGASSRSRSYVDIIRQALMSGAAYLDDAENPGQPPKSRELASGWRPQTGRDGMPDYQSKGAFVGWLNEDGSAYLLPNAATAAARTLADKSGEGFTGTPKTVGETLKADGMLVSHGNGADSQRRAEVDLPRPLVRAGLGKRAWHVSAAAWSDEDDGAGGAPTSGMGAPTSAPIADNALTCGAPTSYENPAPAALPAATADTALTCGAATAPTAPTSGMGAPTAAPTSKVPLTCGAPTAPTENPEFEPPLRAHAHARDTTDNALTCGAATAPTENPAGLGATAPTSGPAPTSEVGAPVPGPEATETAAHQAWMKAARQTDAARRTPRFRTDAQWAALEEATRRLDEPDIDDHPERLRILARLEGGSKQSGPFAPQRKGAHPFPYWHAPMPQAAYDIRIREGYAWDRGGGDGQAVALDRSGAWPSATSSVDVAHGALTRTGPLDLENGAVRPGYYLVTDYPWLEAGLPHPLGTSGSGEQIWITAPDMALLRDLHRAGRWPDATAADSWTGDPGRLSDWAHYVAELRRYAIQVHGRDSAAYSAVKTGFGMATSMLQGEWNTNEQGERDGKTWPKCKARRLDWFHHIARQSAVILWRAANACLTAAPELGPVALRNNDELVIPRAAVEAVTTKLITPLGSSTPRPAVRLDPLGIELGTFKVKEG